MNSCIYCLVDSWKILADVLWVTEIHDPSVFIVTGKTKKQATTLDYLLIRRNFMMVSLNARAPTEPFSPVTGGVLCASTHYIVI